MRLIFLVRAMQPLVPAAHTQVVTYVVAERASDMIKAAWS